jgi:signal transduction histidine kinase
MYQVFQNLFNNSIEAFKEHSGIIKIKTRISNSSKETKEVKIEVSDNGPGIDISIIDKIFNYGFSSKSPTGRGLGLAIAKKLVEENLGKIEFYIPENCNSSRIPAHFIVTLPKAQAIV